MSRSTRRALRPAVWVVYVLIVLEFLFMISPAALAFYSAYGPFLNVFHGSEWTAWLTSFYLPHFSETTSPLLNALKPLGFWLAYLGLGIFLIGAVHIYGSKLLRRGAVTGGLYRWVRHPQYTGLGILGLGLALVWPRFLVAASFATMAVLYVLLAVWEEAQCREAYGEPYLALTLRTGMFFPRPLEAPFRALLRALGSWTPAKVAGAYACVLTLTLGAAFAAREHTLDHVSSYYAEGIAVLSPARMEADRLRAALELGTADPGVRAALDTARAPLLAYVVPESWYVPDLPLHSEEEIRRIGGGHHTPRGADPSEPVKVLFTVTRTYAEGAEGEAIVRSAYAVDPLVIVHVDLVAGRVLGLSEPPRHVIWGDIPTPRY